MSNSTISRTYQRILPQIYSAEEPTTIGLCYAVTLWLPAGLLSHRTAAWLYGWTEPPQRIEVTVPRGAKLRMPKWLRMYRRTVPGREATEVQRLPVVNRERTFIDCIAVMQPDDVGEFVDNRLALAVDRDKVEALIRRTPHLAGNVEASKQLRLSSSGFASEPERVLDRTLIGLGLRLRINFSIGPYICDLVDVLSRVIVEVDGREFHIGAEVFSRDRRRQNALVLEGWLVLRYSAFDVMANPGAVAREIAEVVLRRRKSRR